MIHVYYFIHMNVVVHHCLVFQTSNVLVTGLKWISDSFSVPFPQYMPLMVLHDPPGGTSESR
jgi:hypothetical protein